MARHGQVRIGRLGALAAIGAALAWGLCPGGAWAQVLAVFHLDDDKIEMKETEAGGIEGTVTVTNLSAEPVDLAIEAGSGLASCRPKATPSTLPAERAVSVKLEASSCKLPTNGAEVSLTAGEVAAEVTLVPAKAKESVDTTGILAWFAASAIVALVGFGIMVIRALVEKWGLFENVEGVDAKWSLKDSWASNLSLLVTGFAAVFGATDVLEAVLGEEPEVAVARALIGGVIGALFVAAGPLALKAFGKTTSPTVLGLLVAGALTMTGVLGQLAVICWAVNDTKVDQTFQDAALYGGALAGVGLLWYAWQSLGALLREGFADATKRTVNEGEVVAAALLLASPDGSVDEAVRQAKELRDELAKVGPTEEAKQGQPSLAEPKLSQLQVRALVGPTCSGVL